MTISPELARERDYVSTLYARLDALRVETQEQLDAVRASNVGGTHQNRSERDSFARIYTDRMAQLNEVDERLAFGRLELQGGQTRYIGRIGLRDLDQQPILLDWRVPQASAFYQATAATPLGARARRHLTSKGREVTRIEDEIFDTELLEGDTSELQGEGALLAALRAERTGRMSDIVATIQAEQDRIIRSDLAGVLVVQGGPGTGKTAVALHRAAFLLYSHRERLRSTGVLIVGPSPSFLQYIEAVLPSLGETGVVLASVGQLYPGVDTTIEDLPDVAALKGSARMADIIAKGVKSRQQVPSGVQVLEVNGEKLRLEPRVVATAMAAAQHTRKPHNVARQQFQKSVLTSLTKQLAEQLKSHGNTVDEDDYSWLREDLRASYDVRVALNTAWLPLTPEKFIQDMYARPNWLATLTPRWTDEERALLRRDRDAPFTISDIPLLDEAAELLGEFDAKNDAEKRERKQQRKRDIENAEAAIHNMGVEGLVNAEDLAAGFGETAVRGTTAERAAADRSWTYGHIVVDEAQELSPMQWRVLRRRCPLRSFTIVGDVAQASAAAAAPNWREALRSLTTDFRLEELTVNYRTPAQITEAAEAMAVAHGLPITSSRAVRDSEWPVDTLIVDPDDLLSAAVDVADEDREIDSRGTLAVIVPPRLLDALYTQLESKFGLQVGRGTQALGSPIALLTPQESKGLEFDAVVIVEPNEIITGSARGVGALYVAMTRPTQRLHMVGSSPLA
ncbi:UvrD-helicase domain-containing protein [Glaciihabitans sp. dw_435]|uniref:HelD family protein n=1 Tax=Glaciihabitans sp. dw_435 TaxID=2720081 RepID=UPI001BD66211|nr:UvrD-helicase domain-containing protein [Glaciihabitans sp. dw_435]